MWTCQSCCLSSGEHYDDPDEAESPCCSHTFRSTQQTPVTNVLVWLDCYASMVVVLCSAHPEKFSQLMAYQKTIILTYRGFAGDGWVKCDSSYQQQAANVKFLDWGQMDGNLWNEILMGRAKAVAWCRIFLCELHSHADYPPAPDGNHPLPQTPELQK